MMEGTPYEVPAARTAAKIAAPLVAVLLGFSAPAPAGEQTVVIPYEAGRDHQQAIYIPAGVDPTALGSGSFVVDEWDNFRRPDVDFSALYGVREASRITGITLAYTGYKPLVAGHAIAPIYFTLEFGDPAGLHTLLTMSHSRAFTGEGNGPFSGTVDILASPIGPGVADLLAASRYSNLTGWASRPVGFRLLSGGSGKPAVSGFASFEITITVETSSGGGQIPGDANQDGKLDLADPVSMLNTLFLGADDPLPCGDGNPADPGNVDLLDTNGDGKVDLSDPVWTLNYLFLGGPEPTAGTACIHITGCPGVCPP